MQRTEIFKSDDTKKDICKSSDFNTIKEKIICKYKESNINFVNSFINFIGIITQRFKIRLTINDVVKFASGKELYRALRNAIFTNLYLQYHSNKHNNNIGLDKFSDFLILVESSYCSAILTNEKKLGEHFNQIDSNISVVEFNDLIKKSS